ncbi:Rpn family recombination-promoting nuclease/putative transposase [Methanobrevibacter arboriphilus]|nr:Rpn family recombination-promoting nuclease/putative transposase [Methanobrevibacter arboriphilus]
MYDFLFSNYMASKGCEKQLAGLINAILVENNEDNVFNLKIIDNKFLLGKVANNKNCILDLRSKSFDGRVVNIEVQRQGEKYFRRRSHLYISREFSNSAEKGGLERLKSHILINIIDFGFCKNNVISRKFNMIDKTEFNCEYSDCIKIINVNVSAFRNLKAVDFDNPLHCWLLFLDKKSTREMIEMAMSKDENIKIAHEKVEELLKDEAFLHELNKREQADLKYEGEMAYREEKGIKKGIKKGKKEGIEEGIKKGELNIAKRMKNSNFSFDDIAKITGLSLDEIEKL